MMKILKAVFLVFAFQTQVFAQDEPIDPSAKCITSMQMGDKYESEKNCEELSRFLAESKKQGAQRLNALTAYTSYLATKKLAKSDVLTLDKEVKRLKPKTTEDFDSLGNANFILANLYSQLSEYKIAADRAASAISAYEKSKNTTSVIDSISLLSDIHLKVGDKTRALAYSTQTYELVQKIKPDSVEDYDRLKYSVNKSIALARIANGLTKDALKPAIDASLYVDRIDPLKTSSLSVSIHSFLASLYLLLSDYDNALPHALIATNRIGDKKFQLSSDVASGVMSLFQIYYDTDNPTHARNFADRITPMILSEKDSAPKIKILGTLGSYYMKNEDTKPKARSLVVAATMISYKMFGSEAKITLELAELADSIESDAEASKNQSLQK